MTGAAHNGSENERRRRRKSVDKADKSEDLARLLEDANEFDLIAPFFTIESDTLASSHSTILNFTSKKKLKEQQQHPTTKAKTSPLSSSRSIASQKTMETIHYEQQQMHLPRLLQPSNASSSSTSPPPNQ
eukprot:m.110392 g.110392  ORF g.110392 m.110392 type:complete len:130 (-) comp12745_c0_seq2:252-641(-)